MYIREKGPATVLYATYVPLYPHIEMQTVAEGSGGEDNFRGGAGNPLPLFNLSRADSFEISWPKHGAEVSVHGREMQKLRIATS